MTLLANIQSSLALTDSDIVTDKATGNVVYRPNDDVLLTTSYTQARKIIESIENRHLPIPPGRTADTYNANLIRGITISPDNITWVEDVENGIFYRSTSYFNSMKISVTLSGYRTFDVRLGRVKWEPHGGNWTASDNREGDFSFWRGLNKDEAVSLANAFYVLKRYAEGYKPEDEALSFADFQKKAKAWRALTVKPALPEDVQRCRIMAEDAFKNKDFQKALMYYEKGLAIEPLWPQGQFNAAMLAGELQASGTAAAHMKRYLELVPGAGNAKFAREKMYLWEEKAKEASTQ
jgi:tetratricopeptide (TPR) repeat protein